MMDCFCNSPTDSVDGSDVVLVHDYLKQKTFDMISHLRHDIHLPKSNVLQYILQDGTKISMRPSGTEPKIKFYFGLRGNLNHPDDYEHICQLLDERAERIKKSMGLS